MSRKAQEIDISAWLASTERLVRRIGDTKAAVVRCRFDASLEDLWVACTDRDQLRRWFADVSGDMREGATLTFDVGAPHVVTSRILRCEPASDLRFTWFYPGRTVDEVEVRLTADGGGVRAELEHRSDDKTEWWIGAGPGWEHALIRLSVLLQGAGSSAVSAEEIDQKLGPLWTGAGQACA